ncbi:MAG: hypothetical protein MHM6MM_003784 [Cercozoa sp. M6MM]
MQLRVSCVAAGSLCDAVAQRMPVHRLVKWDQCDTPSEERIELARQTVKESDALLISPHCFTHVVDLLHTDEGKQKFVQSPFAGVDAFLKHTRTFDAHERNFVFARFAHDFGVHMREFVLCAVLDRERQWHRLHHAQKQHQWLGPALSADAYSYRLLRDVKVAVIGLGSIGNSVAECFKLLGSDVSGVARSSGKSRQLEKVYVTQEMPGDTEKQQLQTAVASLLREQKPDYLVSVLPHTPSTEALLEGGVVMEALKESRPVLVNVGRGSLISTSHLLHLLDSDYLSHAIVDVWDQEPLPSDNAAWQHPKVTLTPHVSAMSTPSDVAHVFAANLEKFAAGDAANIRGLVDLSGDY